MDEALKLWENGEVLEAYRMAEEILKSSPKDDTAIFLKMKTSYMQGKYNEAIEAFKFLKESFEKYPYAVNLAVEAYIHLKDYESAWKLAKKHNLKQTPYLEELKKRPFKVIADKTHVVPFRKDPPLPKLLLLLTAQVPNSFMPSVNGKVNGKNVPIRFDTGGEFLAMGKAAAKKLGIELKYESKVIQNATQLTVWYAIADSMEFKEGPLFLNVPVAVVEGIKGIRDYIIFGTNILEQFLSTIDYPNDRFIFTPRNRHDLYEQHYKLLPTNHVKIPFYLWRTHFMIAKGKFAGCDNLNLFFDSGLVAIKFGARIKQASFTAPKRSLLKWGFNENKLTKETFFPTEYALEVAELSQPNTLIFYDPKMDVWDDFGGIRIDGLISHAWLKNYSWTIDFEKHEYSFGTKQ